MATIVDNLRVELEELDKEYGENFAGQSRLSRDVDLLDEIIKKTGSVLTRIDQIPQAVRGPELVRLRDTASQNLVLYNQERAAILRAQEVGPTFEAFSSEATAANMVFARYARHFAGKDRSTRDVALLGELVDELKQIDKRMTQVLEETTGSTDFERDRRIVRENLTQYQKEIGLIEAAQTSGTPEQQASILATLANEQFASYQRHFAGEPRVSRRPALLMRIVASLKKIHERMSAFADKPELDFNLKNRAIVEERLKIYEAELAEIRKLRQATTMPDIMGELGGAANNLFDEYRKNFADKPRSQVDLELLGRICDKLAEIRRQMTDMARAEDNEMNMRNLDIVSEQLVMFESEFEAVLRSRSPAKI
jgi:hypothetical protein